MALTFSKAVLLDAAETAISEATAARDAWDKAAAERAAAHKAEWTAKRKPRLRELRDYLTAQLKSTKAVTALDARKALDVHNVENLFYSPEQSYERDHHLGGGRPGVNNVADYHALVDMLNAHSGDEITASQLKSVGFGNLAPLFRAVAAKRLRSAQTPE